MPKPNRSNNYLVSKKMPKDVEKMVSAMKNQGMNEQMAYALATKQYNNKKFLAKKTKKPTKKVKYA